MFVPGGWWHAVLNLDDTMALTQNFMSKVNFEAVWKSFRSERKKLSCRFLRKLKEGHPELYEKARTINKRDNFLMYDEKKNIDKRSSEYDLEDEIHKKVKTDSTNSSTSSSSSSSSSSESRSASKK